MKVLYVICSLLVVINVALIVVLALPSVHAKRSEAPAPTLFPWCRCSMGIWRAGSWS